MTGLPGMFETARFRVRPLVADDVARYCALYTDATVMRLVGPALTMSAARTAFEAVLRQTTRIPPRAGYWMIVAREDARDRGLMALTLSTSRRCAELGLLLGAGAQRDGVASEAATGLLDLVFAAPGLDRIWTRHARGHAAAEGLMRRLQFTPEALGDGRQRWHLERDAWRFRVADNRCFASAPATG